MSLGTHGDDREVDRAQHLFCHGAEQDLAEPAAAPGPEKNLIRVKLPGRGRNLLGGMSLAHQGVASDVAAGGKVAPGLELFFGEFEGGGEIVIGHADGIHGHGGGGGDGMEEDEAGPV